MCCSCKPQPANAFPSLTLQRHADVEWRVGLQRAEPYAQLAHQLDTAAEHGQQGSTHALAAASLVLTSQQSLCQQGKRTGRQADRYADRQGGVRSARQTPRQADRQASTSQAVLSTLHHHPPSAPTAKHGCYTYYNILWHGWQAVQVLQAGCGYAPIQLVLVEPLHTQAVACMLTNVSISSGCARGSLRCQPQWWCCVEWLVLLTRQYGPNSSTKNTSSALRKQARSTQVLLLSCLAGLHSHAAVSADVLVSNMICRWHRSWLQ